MSTEKRKLVDYAILKSSSYTGLEDLVKDTMQYDWELHGSIFLSKDNDAYMQAMIKFEDKSPKVENPT